MSRMAEKSNKPTPPPPPDGKVRLERNGRGELVLHLPGNDEPVANVGVARCFPWSLRREYVSIRDGEGKELVLLKTLEGLDDGTVELIDQELRDRFFVPRIARIVKHSAEFGVISITAETDRGEVDFQMRDREDVRLLAGHRAVFRDVDGNVYEVADVDALDAASRRHLEQYF